MLTDLELIEYLERLRLENNLSIQEITKGIISRRNYSRYISSECPLNIQVLTQLLKRIGIPLNEFICYITNKKILENLDELLFHELIMQENYVKAYTYYQKLQNKQLQSNFASKSIPMGINLMLFKMNLISLDEVKKRLTKILNLDEIINKTIINDDEIEAIYIFIRIAEVADKEKILKYFLNVLFDSKYIIISNFLDKSKMLCYLITLKILIEDQERFNNDLINNVIKSVLDCKNSIPIHYEFLLFELIYKYLNKKQIENKDVTYRYALLNICFGIRQVNMKDFNNFFECLQEKGFLEK